MPSLLITTQELAGRIGDASCVIFDCRHDLLDLKKGEQLYRAAHIPGAYFASLERDLAGAKTGANGRHPLPSPEAFADFLAGCGVNAGAMLVAYDDAGGQYATRLWWLARWIGLRNVLLLDGGLPKWVAESRAVTPLEPSKRHGKVTPVADHALVWTANDVAARAKTTDFVLIDARAPERYRGEVEPIDPVAGHIPGALNRFHKNNLNANLTLRPAAELQAEFKALLGDVPPANAVHYCGSGVTACANVFAMENAGLTGSKLYAGSWSEWVADATRPVAHGELA